MATLTELISIDRAAECDPSEVGVSSEALEKVWGSLIRAYQTGVHPAISIAVRRKGKVILKRSIGSKIKCAGAKSETRFDPESPICLFSASKVISSILVHKAIEEGYLKIDLPVAELIPEFARHGKSTVSIAHLLSHRAGIPVIDGVDLSIDCLGDKTKTLNRICNAKPLDQTFLRPAYHPFTTGFVIGEILERATGRPMNWLLKEWLAGPLDCQYLTFGLCRESWGKSPESYQGDGFFPRRIVDRVAKRFFGLTIDQAVKAANSEAFKLSVVPAGNVWATADEACRVFQMLLDQGRWNGRQVLARSTVATMTRSVDTGHLWDRTLGFPVRYSLGTMRGGDPVGLFGPRSKNAYGHIGFVSIACWADPSRDMSVALLNTGKSLAPSGLWAIARVMNELGNACPSTK